MCFGHILLMCKILFKNTEIASNIFKNREILQENPNFCLLLKNQEVCSKPGPTIPQGKS